MNCRGQTDREGASIVRRGLATIAILVLAGCGSPSSVSQPPSASGSTVVSAPVTVPSASGPSPQAGLLLTEVRFAPIVGDAAFVEISNVSTKTLDLAGIRLRVGKQDFVLAPRSIAEDPGSQIVVSFLTPGSTDRPGISAPDDIALTAGSGSVALVDPDGRILDRIAWGTGQEGAVAAPSGDPDFARIEPGTALARQPGANGASQPTDWAVYPPGLVSPGRANPPQ